MVPTKQRASLFPIFCHPALPSFHFHFLVVFSFLNNSGVDLIEMMLHGGIVASVHITVTFQGFISKIGASGPGFPVSQK